MIRKSKTPSMPLLDLWLLLEIPIVTGTWIYQTDGVMSIQ